MKEERKPKGHQATTQMRYSRIESNIEIYNLAFILLLHFVSLCLDSVYKIACRLQNMGTREWKRESIPVCFLKLFTCFLLRVKLEKCIRRSREVYKVEHEQEKCIWVYTHTLCLCTGEECSLHPVAGMSYSHSGMPQVTALNL